MNQQAQCGINGTLDLSAVAEKGFANIFRLFTTFSNQSFPGKYIYCNCFRSKHLSYTLFSACMNYAVLNK